MWVFYLHCNSAFEQGHLEPWRYINAFFFYYYCCYYSYYYYYYYYYWLLELCLNSVHHTKAVCETKDTEVSTIYLDCDSYRVSCMMFVCERSKSVGDSIFPWHTPTGVCNVVNFSPQSSTAELDVLY